MATITKAQQKVMIQRVLARQQPVNQPLQSQQPGMQQPQGMEQMPATPTGMSGAGTQSPDAGSFGQPTDMHSALAQAEQAWMSMRGAGHSLWSRIHPEAGHKGQPEDSFLQSYTKYLLNPQSITNDRVRSFMDHTQRMLTGNDPTVQLPEEQNPALQALSLGDPNASNIG